MEKRIIIAVDGSPSALHAVDYVGLMEGALIRELRVTLVNVMHGIPPQLSQEGGSRPEAYRRLRELQERNLAQAREVLDQARDRLLRHGLRAERLEVKALPRMADPARDLLFTAEKGLYDALVLGRRGLSKAQELFLGSVTNQVAQHADRLPLWVVGGRVTSLKVLCPVDGSQGSLKAVDHLAFMLGGNPDCRVTLFHVGAALSSYCPVDFGQPLTAQVEGDLMDADRECMDDFYARAMGVLHQAGLEEDQVEVVDHGGGLGSVAAAILEEASRGDYGTVVMGRRGESRSFFLGRTSNRVLARGEEVALWLVG